MHFNKGEYEKALDYYDRSLKIYEELGDKREMGYILHNIGRVLTNKSDYDKALDYYERSLAIQEELGDKHGKGHSLNSIGDVHKNKGEYNTALEYYVRSLAIQEELGDNFGISFSLNNIGNVHYSNRDYDKMFSHLQKAINIQKEIGALELETVTLFALVNKNLSQEYDDKEIHSLIKKTENIECELNLLLYELLENKSYLETAYSQVQEKASEMEKELAHKFLSYPIAKQIVEEWEKVSKVTN